MYCKKKEGKEEGDMEGKKGTMGQGGNGNRKDNGREEKGKAYRFGEEGRGGKGK